MQQLMRYFEMGYQILSRIIDVDETWCHHFDPATKIMSMVWRHSSFPQPKKACSSNRAGKVTLACFYDVDGPLLLEWLLRARLSLLPCTVPHCMN
ncbi:hypothetical protein NPIL_489211 [Nephila pilipes]|uniref:Uncharacterized protein n=1 Tax=Nephila pilipes TaxID=299642 RepID=A0A8X6TA10_NEPPI|nr:hypothetical protein NPIL_489211 [Nephila pilipes]